MTTTPSGTKKVPLIVGDPAPTLRADHNALGNWADAAIDRRVADATARGALADKYVGMMVQTANDNVLWLCTNAASTGTWVPVNYPTQTQIDTTNSTPRTIRQHGRGRIASSATQILSEAVVFPQAFSGVPTVTCSYIGRVVSGGGAYNDVGLNAALIGVFSQALAPSTTGFTAALGLISGNFSAGSDYYYGWIAEGPA